jgi:hypothetical protein
MAQQQTAQRKQIAKAFCVARQQIARGTHSYVCHALPATVGGAAAKKVVEARLAGCTTVAGWLSQKASPRVSWHLTVIALESGRNMREYRLRWLDALIKEFSA